MRLEGVLRTPSRHVLQSGALGQRRALSHTASLVHGTGGDDLLADLPLIAVGPFEIADVSRATLLHHLASSSQRRVAFALHVGGLNERDDKRFVQTLNSSGVTYADGASVVFLARLGGAKYIQRAPTTDLGHALLAQLAQKGAQPKFAVIGGVPGVARAAADRLERLHGAKCVFATDGFRETYSLALSEIRRHEPQLLIIGMGMPREAQWVSEHWHDLPDALILTCGGWLGFLTGVEQRAPEVLQRHGLEWLYRLRQDPARLVPRYAVGIVSLALLAPSQICRRFRKLLPSDP